MKKIILLFLLLPCTFVVFSQSKKDITVVPSHAVMDKVDRQGMQVSINLDEKFVTKCWEKKLKEFGKVETSKGTYIIRGAVLTGISSACTIYSIVESDKNSTIVLWAIDIGSGYITSGHEYYKNAESKLKEFAVQAYIADINEQIKTAEGALNSSVKTQQKYMNERESLKRDIQKNKQQKINLEDKLKTNASDLIDLNKKSEQNIVKHKAAVESKNLDDQEKLMKEAENIQKNIEKNKQQKIDLEDKIKQNTSDLNQLERDTDDNEKNIRNADNDVSKMQKALDIVKQKLKLYE